MRSTIAWCEKDGAAGARSTPYASSRGRLVSSVSRYSKVVMTTTMSSSGTPVKWSRRALAKSGNEAQALRGHRFDDRGARAGAAEDRSDDHAARVVRRAAEGLELKTESRVDEGAVEALNRVAVGARERQAEGNHGAVHVARGRRRRRLRVHVRRDLRDRRPAPVAEIARRRAARQPAQVLDACRAARELRLEEQVEQQIVPAHVDDVRDRRADPRDVRVILV